MTTPHVSEVRAQHFRSFGDETVVRLKPGLNLVVGPNGSGKSNILDAMLFALTRKMKKVGFRRTSAGRTPEVVLWEVHAHSPSGARVMKSSEFLPLRNEMHAQVQS